MRKKSKCKICEGGRLPNSLCERKDLTARDRLDGSLELVWL